MKERFQSLLSQIRSEGEEQPLIQLAERVCQLLYRQVEGYDWVGVYMLEDDQLHLRAWAGDAATEHTVIDLGEGICGLAAREKRTVNVPDVGEDDRYLACFTSTRSELVVPIMKDDEVYGEIDIDSDKADNFDREDEAFVNSIADVLADKAETEAAKSR